MTCRCTSRTNIWGRLAVAYTGFSTSSNGIHCLTCVGWARGKYILSAMIIAMSSVGFAADLSLTDQPVTAKQRLEQGWIAYHHGDMRQAAKFWGESAAQYQLDGQMAGRIEALRNQSAAFRAMGQYPRASELLMKAIKLAQESGGHPHLLPLYDDYGVLMTLTQKFDSAKAAFDESLVLAVDKKNLQSEASVHNNLGNLYAAQEQYEDALQSYRQCIELSQDGDDMTLLATVMTNAAVSASRTEDPQRAVAWAAKAMDRIGRLSQTQEQTNLYISIGHMQQALVDRLPDYREDGVQSALQAYRSGLQGARVLEDPRSMSYALEGLAQLYEAEQRTDGAMALAQQAVRLADRTHLSHVAYRLHRQIGRLWLLKGDRGEAISAYEKAINAFGSIHQDAAIGQGNRQQNQDLGQEKRVVLSELADLLLQQADASDDPATAQRLIRQAIETLERLKTAELVDYFQDQCLASLQARTARIEDLSPDAAVVYIVSLADRTEILLISGGNFKRFKVAVDQQQLAQEAQRFRDELEDISTYRHLRHAQTLYKWLIAPIIDQLESSDVHTLVFVPDGPLRLIPMAALHDGQNFLIQRYAVAVTPGLRLTDAKPFDHSKIQLLAAGLTVSKEENFIPLPYAGQEIEQVTDIFSGTKLIDQNFVLGQLQQQLREHAYTIFHIASHGQFRSNSDETFLLAYDSKINLSDLEGMVRPARFRNNPIELLVLSACQTAVGDDRAAMGLAGVAVKAGARSALATLWSVHDQTTAALMTEFYRQIRDNQGLSKAKALQRAQLKLLEGFSHHDPYFWSPFLIIGNWL